MSRRPDGASRLAPHDANRSAGGEAAKSSSRRGFEQAGTDEWPSRTAEVAAIFRAGALNFPPDQRLVEDPYARFFVPLRYRMTSAIPALGRFTARVADRVYPGMIGQTVLRCRYGDDGLRDAVAAGVTQAIMLGSGYDATALRLGDLPVRFFEVDQPATMARKRRVLLERLPAGALSGIRFVPCRFDRDSLRGGLLSSGFDPAQPAFVSWLAVTWYLSAEAVETTLRELAALLEPDSRLVFDYLHPAAADSTDPRPGVRRSGRAARRRGEPWTFGIEPTEVRPWLARLGFSVEDHLTAAELTRRYFPTGAVITGADYISLVTARRRS